MSVAAWRNLVGPPLIAAVVAAAVVGPAIASPDRPVRSAASARSVDPASVPALALAPCDASAEAREPAWFVLDAVLDGTGGLAGQRLSAGAVGSPPALILDLDAESFASAPLDGQIVIGTDDGSRSRVRIVDADRGCETAGFETSGLVRRALHDPDRDAVIEFRLDRRTRADLGIWRRPVGGGDGTRIAEPLPASERLGLIFSTELAWSAERDRVVVTSCGEAACVVRLIDPAGGSVATVDDPGIGEAIGLAGSTLVAYGGCPGLPCNIVAHDVDAGTTRELASVAGLAAFGNTDDGPVLVFEDVARGGEIVVAGLRDSDRGRVQGADQLRVVPGPHRARAGIETPPGFVAVDPSGRPATRGGETQFVRLVDRRLLPASEVLR